MNKELEALRKKAEKALAGAKNKDPSIVESDSQLLDPAENKRLLEELRIYQAELEIQNLQLRESEAQAKHESQRYMTLFDSMPVGALVVDRSAVIIEANVYAAELFDFRGPQRLLRHSLFRLFDPESSLWIADRLNGFAKKQALSAHEKLLLHTDKAGTIPVEGYLVALPRHYALDQHFLLMLRDLRSEYQLERYHRLTQTLIDNADALIFVFDENARCLMANNKVAQITGCEVEDMIGRRRADFMSVDEAERHEANDKKVLLSGESRLTEESFKDAKGNEYRFLSHKFPLPDQDGKPFAVAGITSDITHLKRIETQLNLAMQVFSQGSEGIVITNSNAQVTYVNSAFEKITGYTSQDIIGQNPHRLSSGRHDAAFWKNFWTELAKTGRWMGEVWNRRRNGEVYPQFISVSRVVLGPCMEPQYIGVFRDITEQKQHENTIEKLAFYDELTGCANRYLLKDRVTQKIAAIRRSGGNFAFLFIDLDHFKDVNDVHGHRTGDELLRQVVSRVVTHLRETDTISRIGGDEFVVLMSGLNREGLKGKAESLIKLISAPYRIYENEINISASIGVACYPEHGSDYDLLLKHADTAMYVAKEQGRNTYVFYDQKMSDDASIRLSFDTAMRQSLQQGHFSLVYQPQYDLKTQKILGVEALLRWSHPTIGSVGPDVFIPIAEQSDLINELGAWVLEEALSSLAGWHDQGWSDLRISVNVSSRQFWALDFRQQVANALEKTGISSHFLELELTERLTMQDMERLVVAMDGLRQLGVRLSIDDFGTGYSSLMYLKKLPFHVLKIDRSFVTGLPSKSDDAAICRTILNMASTFGFETIAEGVENLAQEEFLAQSGCQMAQGYFFSTPLNSEEMQVLLNKRCKMGSGPA